MADADRKVDQLSRKIKENVTALAAAIKELKKQNASKSKKKSSKKKSRRKKARK